MRIVEVIRSMNMGGSQNLLIQRLGTPEASKNLTLVINTLPNENALMPEKHSPGIYTSTRSGNPLLAHLEVLRTLKQFKPDIVVVHSPTPAILIKLSKLLGLIKTPITEVVHSTEYRSWIVMALSRLTNPGVDLCLPVSRAVYESKVCNSAKKRVLLHQGIDQERMLNWRTNNKKWVSENKFPKTKKGNTLNLVFCGRFENQKRPLDAVRVMKQLKGEPVFLTMVGWGSLGPEVVQFVERNELTDQVRILGEQGNGWRYFAGADLVLLTSETEGLGLVLMEAVTFGLAVVATDIGGVKDIVFDGVNGKLVPVGNINGLSKAIKEFLLNNDEMERYSRESLKISKNWSGVVASERFYKTIGQMLENRARVG